MKPTHTVWLIYKEDGSGDQYLGINPVYYGSGVEIGEMCSIKSTAMFRGSFKECEEYIDKQINHK